MIANFKSNKVVACLDMGSSKLVCIIATIGHNGLKVIGYGHKEARGTIGSTISDMLLAQKSIISVISQAERMAGINIDQILVNISANHVRSYHEVASTKVSADSVRNCDIISLTEKVRSHFKKKKCEVIHLIPLQYNIDNLYAVDNPRYMTGNELSAKFHVIATPKSIIQNIESCLKKCQISISNYVVDCYASSLSCLGPGERDLRTLLIDIGSRYTSCSLFSDSKLIYVNSLNLGGYNLTKDVSTILNIDYYEAEKIKNLNSSLVITEIEKKELIKVGYNNANSQSLSINRYEFREIIQSRLEEIFSSIKRVLEGHSIQIDMISNIVVTGGTASCVGIDRVVSDVFLKNVRIGYPKRIDANGADIFSPNNSCALGMLEFLHQIHLRENAKHNIRMKNSWVKRVFDKISFLK